MSINVTVNGNPISIRRGKMVLSDLENIKKIDREHRKRLRLEQVQEQSRALSKRLLERARQVEEEQLKRLEKDGNTEMKRARDRRLLEIHRRYQDIENIGYAHENAAKQPDVETIKQAEEQKNKAMAKARGADAAQRLQEDNKAVDPHAVQQERLRKIRDLEKERSSMVAQLSKKSCIADDDSGEISESENIVKATPAPSSKRRAKCVVSKKSPIKKSSKQTKVHSSHTKTSSNVSVNINNEDISRTPTATFSMDKNRISSLNKSSNVPKTVSDTLQEVSRINVCESDDNEPRKSVPVTSSISKKPEKFLRCSSKNYKGSSSDLSSTSTTSSSSISDDSSYFSDNNSKTKVVKKTPRRHTSPVSTKVDLYDHKTRQRNSYDRPSGLVERMNMKNQPNAEDLAQEIIQLESKESTLLATRKDSSEKRSQDAILREKIRRDYQALLKNLDQLSKEENKLKNAQVLAPSKKKEDLAKKQKKMDRAFQNILRTSRDSASCDNRAERPITLTPHDYVHSNPTPSTAWKEPPCIDDKGSEESYSEDDIDSTRKRKISELLIKIEKMKRRLLQEYGSDLPDDVFNASVKSLFHQSSTSTSQEKVQRSNTPKPATPEIQVINMSSCEDTTVPAPKVTSKAKKINKQVHSKSQLKPSAESIVSTRDQQVQVEIEPKKKQDDVVTYPIEPVVTIITPENADSSSNTSSNSSANTDLVIDVSKKEITVVPKDKESNVKITKNSSVVSFKTSRTQASKTPVKISFEQTGDSRSFEVAGLLIDPEKKEITVLPKRRKTLEKESKRASPIPSVKSHSLPSSRISSPVKKTPKSAPPTRHSSPKKRHSQLCQTESQKRPITTTIQEQRYRTQYTQVSIDSSTESSQLNTTSDTATSNKIYTRFQSMTAKRFVSKVQEVSDTSTTYASPPTAAAGNLLDAMNSSTPILELLDSSVNESFRRNAHLVSPVSSPETPSPRTMMLPSNIPKSGRVNKTLKFTSMDINQANVGSSSVSKSASYSMSKDKSTSTRPKIQPQTQPQIQSQTQPGTCKNPSCKLFHEQLEDTQGYTLKHCPQILKKYEDLQNVCTERIASLTDLIQKVRNEQKGLELSVITTEDSNSASQVIPTGQPPANGDVSKLVKNIEAIHAELKRTLMESQKLITERIELPKLPRPYSEVEKSPTFNFSMNLSKDSTTSESLEEAADKAKTVATGSTSASSNKPKVINDERVNIRLDRFRRGPNSRCSGGGLEADEKATTEAREKATMEAGEKAMTEASTVKPTSSVPDQNEDMVAMLSKEILEQSKKINKSVPVDSLKDSDDSILKSSQAPLKDSGESGKNATSNDENNQCANLETSASEYVPLLAGIPKIPRTLAKGSSTNTRGRPPVTLISGPYRPEIVSPAHELSTIVEFDTPDTVNKSQVSTRSPSNKCRKRLPINEAAPSTTSSPSKRSDATKLTKSKPSVHVPPLPAHQSPHSAHNTSNKSTSKSVEKSPRKSAERSAISVEKRKVSKSESKKSETSDSLHTLPDMHIEQLQQSQENADANDNFRISQISELHSLPDENIEQLLISEICEESKSYSLTPVQNQERDKCDKVTSTSSASLSGLSGVSEITTTPSSDLNLFKCPSSPEEMELALKKWGLGWAIPTLKKTREASALGSSSSSDVTPVNAAARLVSPVKKHQDGTAHELPEISDVSSISIKHANKSTERSVLVKGRTSTPNRLSNTNSDGTISTLGSFSSELNIIVQNQSADITIPNISFSNNKLG